MRCLVIGGSGFIGRYVVRELRERGHDVATASRRGVLGYSCDLARPATVRAVLDAERPDAIINLASLRRGTPEALASTNVAGPLGLMALVRECLPGAMVVLFGSAAEYGTAHDTGPLVESAECHPVSSYGLTKLTATRAALTLADVLQLRVVVLRPFNVVGAACPTDLLVGALIGRALAAIEISPMPALAVGRTDTLRDFIAVEDVAVAVRSVVEASGTAGLYNLCTGRAVSIRQVLDTLTHVVGRPLEWRTDPALVRSDEPTVSVGSPVRLLEATGFTAQRTLEDSIASAWYHATATHDPENMPT